MKYAVYDEYKPTCIEWLPQAPTHWQIKGLRHICRFAYGDSLAAENREEGEVAVYGSNGQVGTHDTSNTLAPVIVVGRKGSFGKLNYSHEPVFAIDTTYFIDKRHSSENLDWLAYALQPLKLDEASKDSAVPGLAREDAYKHKLPVPPLAEQQTIARFLDAKTAQIDELIAKKRKLIAKLKEKRQALIARTVTRGLPPEVLARHSRESGNPGGADWAPACAGATEVTMKDSEVDWLGELPETWDQIRGRFVMAVNPPARRAQALKEADEVSFVPMEAVGEYGGLDLDRTKPLDEIGTGYTAFEEGDVVVAKITPCFENGKGAIARGLKNSVGFGTTELHVLRVGKRLDSQFMFYLTISHTFRMLGESEMYGAGGQKRVPPEFAKDFRIPLPPVEEQQTIARFLDAKTAQIDALIMQVTDAIARLTEYRQALITSAVTGKIDVRGFRHACAGITGKEAA